MTGQGWITGSDIISKPPTKEYREGWERIFGKKPKQTKETTDLERVCDKSPYLDVINGNRLS